MSMDPATSTLHTRTQAAGAGGCCWGDPAVCIECRSRGSFGEGMVLGTRRNDEKAHSSAEMGAMQQCPRAAAAQG